MKANFRLSDVPASVLEQISYKSVDALLSHLEVETVFDVAAIKVLLLIGHQAIHEEMERRGMLEDTESADEETLQTDVQG